MRVDVVNAQNEKVGAIELRADVFGGPVRADLIWESVVQEQAAKRRGTHMTKNRALVSGSGRKPWRQKGTGRARVGEIRNPLWRKGGTVFGPQPRSYDYALPKKIKRGALREALALKAQAGALIVVDALQASETDGTGETAAVTKTRAAAELLKRLGANGKTLVIDVAPDEGFARAARNLAGVRLVASGRVTARDVMDTTRVIATRTAIERLSEVLS